MTDATTWEKSLEHGANVALTVFHEDRTIEIHVSHDYTELTAAEARRIADELCSAADGLDVEDEGKFEAFEPAIFLDPRYAPSTINTEDYRG